MYKRQVSDHEIITTSGFKNYPYLFRISTKEIKSRILTIEEIHKLKIHKSLFGTLTIEVEEAKPLFFNRNTNKLVLSNQKEMCIRDRYLIDAKPSHNIRLRFLRLFYILYILNWCHLDKSRDFLHIKHFDLDYLLHNYLKHLYI